jgi:hypothetical protein
MNCKIFDKNFDSAKKDYLALLKKGYPEKGALKLVANHFQLTKPQRTILYRGIFPPEISKIRYKKRINKLNNEILYIDFFNVQYTITNYLFGRILFISTDKYLKDNGENYHRINSGDIFKRGLRLLVKYLSKLKIQKVILIMDKPMEKSDVTRKELSILLKDKKFKWEIIQALNPDKYLTQLEKGIIATSDSSVIDHSHCKIFDLSNYILKKEFNPNIYRL